MKRKLSMKRLYSLKILLMAQMVFLLTICNIAEVRAGGDYPVDNTSGTDASKGEGNLVENDSVNSKVIAYIYSEAAAELGNSLLDAEFASAYFGVNITAVEDLSATAFFNPAEEMGFLLALTLAENQSIATSIEVLKENPIIEYTQVDGLTDYRYDFVPGHLIVRLNKDTAAKLGNSLWDARVISGSLDVNVAEVRNVLGYCVLFLTLAEESKQSVLDAIAFLNNHPNVEHASKNSYNYFAIEE